MLRFPKLISDGCVLQRGEDCAIWGFGDPGETVAITLREGAQGAGKALARARATIGADGRFSVKMRLLFVGGPHCLFARTGGGETRAVRDVYVGDVFVCAGQSNMELPMCRVRERFPDEFCNGGAPGVHLYKVEEQFDFDAPCEDHRKASWTACASEHVGEISAVSYFLGKFLFARLGVPIGILNLSLGGTPAEAWMSRERLRNWPEKLGLLEQHRDRKFCADLLARQAEKERAWARALRLREQEGAKEAPFSVRLPGTLADWGLEGFCGCVSLCRSFDVPREWAGQGALLRLGTLVDSDCVYVNGRLVGGTPYRYPPRRYQIPEGLLKEGQNDIRIRLVCREGDGRVTSGKALDICFERQGGTYLPCTNLENPSDAALPRADMHITELQYSDLENPSDTALPHAGIRAEGSQYQDAECQCDARSLPCPPRISLAGTWTCQVRCACEPAPEQIFLNRVPAGLFQGMVAPCLPFAVKGVVWYQGESNDKMPWEYEKLLQDLICDWRAKWGRQLPFVVVQLPNCDVDIAPGDAWPQIRQAQSRAAQLPDVAVTVNLDAGEDNDLHPLDKKTVAERAGAALLAVAYHAPVAFAGPRLVCACADLLFFDSADGVLSWKTCKEASEKVNPRLFELAGEDRVYFPAEAEICVCPLPECDLWEHDWNCTGNQECQDDREGQDGQEYRTGQEYQNCREYQNLRDQRKANNDPAGGYPALRLRSSQVAHPRYVRYAWDRAPGGTLLADGAGRLASPFEACVTSLL